MINKVIQFSGDKLANLLTHLDCTQAQLPDFGYYPTAFDSAAFDSAAFDSAQAPASASGRSRTRRVSEVEPKAGSLSEVEGGVYITYEPSTDLRDAESVPLNNKIHRYFLAEVKPHVEEAWINLDSTKIGYEISFNKYFYRHKPLRSLEEVANDIIDLEHKAEGLIAQILGFDFAHPAGSIPSRCLSGVEGSGVEGSGVEGSKAENKGSTPSEVENRGGTLSEVEGQS